jgi:dephospho-CoA kinase
VRRPLQIGITGGIGSGKTLVCKIFISLGIPVYDSDHRAKSLMTTDGILMSQIRKEFGDLSYDINGVLNRQYIAEVVFADEEKLNRLNQLVHPRVAEDYRKWVSEHRGPYLLKEAALLFETGAVKQLDKVIVVYAPEEVRIKRVLARDKHRSARQIEEIIGKQMPDSEKIKQADFVVNNDETELLVPQVLSLHEKFIKCEAV